MVEERLGEDRIGKECRNGRSESQRMAWTEAAGNGRNGEAWP